MLTCTQNSVSLRGISLKGSFSLYNPSQNLAVVFQILPSSNLQFEIEPKRGIIMQEQTKKIRIWVLDHDKEKALQISWASQHLIINCTMKTQYNRKMFEQLRLRGWSKVKDTVEEIKLPILLSSEAFQIRSQIQEQISNSVSGNYRSRSTFRNNSRVNSASKKNMDKKLDRQLGYLFDNPRGSNVGEERFQNFGEQVILTSKAIQNFARKGVNGGHFIQHQSSFTSRDSPSPRRIRPPEDSSQNNQKLFQILLLAALAGFFAALGSNLKQLFI